MKEIKFRAWDKKLKMFVNDFWVDNDGNVYYPNSDLPCCKKEDKETGSCLDLEPLMQYTGLKDINDVGIFEGDIVICPNDEKYKIKWHKRMCCFVGYMIDGDYEMFDYVLKETLLKVIGNIYESAFFLETD